MNERMRRRTINQLLDDLHRVTLDESGTQVSNRVPRNAILNTVKNVTPVLVYSFGKTRHEPEKFSCKVLSANSHSNRC